jgi:PAS domain S-box-containing protein
MVHKDGSLRWISVRGTVVYDETGTPVRMSGTDTDITERKQAEEERDRFFSLALDMLCVVGADGYFKRLNPAWERTLGFTTAELLAEPSINFVHPDDRETTRAAMRYAVSGDSLIAFENRYRCKDGSYRWLSWSVTMLPDQQVAYGVARDITARKQAEQERQRQIMQAAVHKERARLARELHDSVTQSLYSINLLSEGCRFHATHGTLEQGEQHFARLGSIAHEALKEMRLLIYQLRLPVLEQEGLIGALQHRLETVERRSQVEAHLQVEGITHLPVDLEENLYWIIQEALNNALKHAGAPAIWVRLAALPPDADGPAPGSYGAFTIQAEVCDNGCGFEPATTQMGMGFASMQERVDYLGGTLTIHAAPGAGTTIRVHCTPRSMM